MARDPGEEYEKLALRGRELGERLEQLESEGYAVDKERIAWRIITDFVEYGMQDLIKGETERARQTLQELELIHSEALESLGTAGPAARVPPRYQTSKVSIEGGHFRALRREPDGELKRGPVIFTGYGHFDQVKSDIPKFADYGINAIQIEIGPSSLLKSEGVLDRSRLEAYASVLDLAAEHNVAVDLLISPHYFPGWALSRYPHLSKCEGGFIHFCIDAPEARQIVSQHILEVISVLGRKPALMSICLSNEPIYTSCAGDPFTEELWAEHLRARFRGDLEQASRVLGIRAGSFEEFPIPEWREAQLTPLFYEWCTFNHARFSGWHGWMADLIHGLAPELPVHAKVMPTFFWRKNVAQGVDPRLFSKLSQINGNDCWCMYSRKEGEYAQDWLWQNMYYDLLRSFENHPVFNSENHIIKDRDFGEIPWQHIRCALWQGAMHGQGATTIWVWERTYNPASDFAGSIMHRPLCARAAGEVSLDLMRFAGEVVALQNAPPKVSILYSVPAMVYDPLYFLELRTVYEASNFLGVRINFVDAREPEAAAPVLLVPSAVHVDREAVPMLRRYVKEGGRLVFIGDECLSRNEHDLEVDLGVEPEMTLDGDMQPRSLWERLRGIVGQPAFEPRGPAGNLVWGIEWISTESGGRELINAVNLLKEPKTISWVDPEGSIALRSLFSGREIGGQFPMSPMEPLLAEVVR